MMEDLSLRKWSGSTLKIIAVITMLIDHIGAILLEPYIMSQPTIPPALLGVDMILRFIGRVAFPIFIFLLIEGFVHTHDRKKYGIHLFIFALLSEIPFNVALNGTWRAPFYQNVIFTLLLGYFAIWIYERYSMNWKTVVGVILCIVLGAVLKTDYGAFGVLAIFLLYYTKKRNKHFYLVGVLLFIWEITAPLAFLIIRQYNGKRGLKLKYFFYFFYPVHLLILGLIRVFVLKC